MKRHRIDSIRLRSGVIKCCQPKPDINKDEYSDFYDPYYASWKQQVEEVEII